MIYQRRHVDHVSQMRRNWQPLERGDPITLGWGRLTLAVGLLSGIIFGLISQADRIF